MFFFVTPGFSLMEFWLRSISCSVVLVSEVLLYPFEWLAVGNLHGREQGIKIDNTHASFSRDLSQVRAVFFKVLLKRSRYHWFNSFTYNKSATTTVSYYHNSVTDNS